MIFFRFGWLSEPHPAATWTLQLCGRANHPQARMTPMGRIAAPTHQSGQLALASKKGQAPTDETRRAPSLIHARRAGDGWGGQRGLAS